MQSALLAAALLVVQPALAQLAPGLSTVNAQPESRSQAVPGCPSNGGALDSISVPVNKSIQLSVVIPAPVTFNASFQLQALNPAVVAAGDKLQGFLPIVTVPAGQTTSNSFALFGVSVGATTLRIIPLSAGFSTTNFPAGAWDLNNSAGSSSKFVDANPPSATCRAAGAATISTSASLLASCGVAADGVATDGATQLLMRALSGLPGTACYEITSTSGLDQGSVVTPLATTQTVGSLNYAFSLYKAPANYGDNSDSRKVTLTFTFTPNIGNANTTSVTADLKVLRPPVVLMHGLWSKPSAWDAAFVRNDSTHTTVAGDYADTNASRFSVNVPKVKVAVDNALKQFRAAKNAGTQVDLIGHSMGGILGRLYANSAQNTRIDNFNLGDIHRLVTLDTPHWGSTLANLLVSLHTVAPAKVNTIGGIIGSVKNGAVCDLAENSPGLQGLGATSVPGSAVNASGGTFPAYRTAIENLLTANVCTSWSFTLPPQCTSQAFLFPQNRVNGFRFQQANDQIVGLTDQQGGVGGPNFASLIHTNVNTTPSVATTAFGLLDGPASGLAATSWPAALSTGLGNPAAPPRGVTGLGAAADQADYTAQCGAGGPMGGLVAGGSGGSYGLQPRTPMTAVRASAASQAVVVTSPVAGQTFAPGATLTVNVQVDPTSNATDVVVGFPPLALSGTTRLDVNNFRAVQTIPAGFAGPLTITPIALDALQNEIQGEPVTVNVVPAVPPTSVAFAQKVYFLEPAVATQQLELIGRYGGSAPPLDLTQAASGTAYASSNPAVVGVSPDGLATVLGPGFGVVTASNGQAKDFAVFVVESSTAPPPPLNVSSAFVVQRGGFRLDRTSGFFVQQVVLTNSSNLPVPGSAYLILAGLPSGVTLVNRSGVSVAAWPGASFMTLPLSPDGRTIAPGQSATLSLQFLNPNRVTINYTSLIYRTSTTP